MNTPGRRVRKGKSGGDGNLWIVGAILMALLVLFLAASPPSSTERQSVDAAPLPAAPEEAKEEVKVDPRPGITLHEAANLVTIEADFYGRSDDLMEELREWLKANNDKEVVDVTPLNESNGVMGLVVTVRDKPKPANNE